MPQIKELNEKFFDVWSEEMSYVLGFIFADGSIFKNPRGSEYLDITSTDMDVLIKIRCVLNSNPAISNRIYKNERWKQSYKIQIGNKYLIKQLKMLTVTPRKSLVMELPNVPEVFLGDFLRGYFDGDGSVNLGRYWRKDRNQWKWEFTTRFTSGSNKFLADLADVLRAHTKGGFIYTKSKNSGFELVFARQDSLNLFKFMYRDTSGDLYLERKYKIFQKAIQLFS